MTIHISARVAWHNNGWNGHICDDPGANTFCVGAQSYPGQLIAEKRSLDIENKYHGQPCKDLDYIPPCCYSHNTFGLDEVRAEAAPPVWFNEEAQTRRWILPPATVCVWPYEEMYGDDVRGNDRYDYEKRLANARKYFKAIEKDRSLIFYYANYSNPFSEDEAKQYVMVGMSRVRILGEELFYDGCSDAVKEKNAGGFVWQRAITSHYPDQGFRLPYHIYSNQPDILDRFMLFPENPRLCKYATRHFEDDDALGLVENFLRVVQELQEMDDSTEDWSVRTRWLKKLISELWNHRGLLPGMPAVLELLSFHDAIPLFKKLALDGKEVEVCNALFSFVDGKTENIPGFKIDAADAKSVRRQWKLRSQAEQRLLKDVLPRFALRKDQLEKILNEDRAENGIIAGLEAIAENPYILSEQYHGNGPDDFIPWGTLDRGMIPSPELGGEALAMSDDARRFRALLVDSLKNEESHVFVPADSLIEIVNRRLSVLPEWKRFSFNSRYLSADEELIRNAVEIRQENQHTFLYLREAYEDERLLEEKLRFLVGGPNISLRIPVTADVWKGYLHDSQSILVRKAPEEYRDAIEKQIEACQRVFVRPIGVLAGEAGTGKTTVIRALIKSIKRGHGIGSSVIALAPTGKAADRIREVVENDEALQSRIEVSTIHSFLAKRGWLNDNMTFKRSGGQVEEGYATYILDESSMLELALTATFFRAVRWPTVQRLILVGDPNQLPPIGRGRLFADIIDFVKEQAPESIAILEHNLRQLVGRLTDGATGIIDIAKCYIHYTEERVKNEDITSGAEKILQRVQEGGDVAPDLRVIYWNGQEELSELLLEQMKLDMAEDVRMRGEEPGDELPEVWKQAHANNTKPAFFQVLSPYRGEFFGIEEINRICQEKLRGQRPTGTNALGGVMLFDKVIQVRNRPKSWPIWAWNHNAHSMETVEIYNGQLGFVWPHLFEKQKWKTPYFRLKKFRVSFDRREGYSVGYGKGLGRDAKNRWISEEKVEENLELAYAISVHKAQGSEFERVFVIVPKSKQTLLSTELFYTAITRARRHCTLFIEQDISSLLGMRRLEASKLRRINSSLFKFREVPEALLTIGAWYEDGRIHQTLADIVVRSKSEVIISNMLCERDIPFRYEQPLYASDGSFYLPDFTINWRGMDYYWEHVGMLHRDDYKTHWEKKHKWYEHHFKGQLIITEEAGDLSKQADGVIRRFFK
ncbi:ATP-dependent RecD-like DNA helicase [Acidobacteriota bacterium]